MHSEVAPHAGSAGWPGWVAFTSLLAVVTFLFYLGGYRHLLVDESASFAVELTMRILEANRDARLLVIGNSTVAEGFRASSYNQAAGARTSLNLGVGSAHFFVYEKLAALALDRGFKPKGILVVLTPESLSRRAGYDELLNDLTLMKTELGLDDYRRLWYHTGDPAGFAEHAARLALRPALYTTDLKDLAVNLSSRARKIYQTYQWLKTAGNDPEALETDNRFEMCDAGPLRDLEPSMERAHGEGASARLADLERVWAGYSIRANQPLAIDARQKERLEHLLNRLAGWVPQVYVAAAPYYDPDFDAYPADYRSEFTAAVHGVTKGVTGVTLLPDFPADCTMFMDTVHLNHTGGDQFTAFLHQQIGNLN